MRSTRRRFESGGVLLLACDVLVTGVGAGAVDATRVLHVDMVCGCVKRGVQSKCGSHETLLGDMYGCGISVFDGDVRVCCTTLAKHDFHVNMLLQAMTQRLCECVRSVRVWK